MTRTSATLAVLLVSLGPAPGAAADEPLPAGAILRLGSTRLKHRAGHASESFFTPDGKRLISRSGHAGGGEPLI